MANRAKVGEGPDELVAYLSLALNEAEERDELFLSYLISMAIEEAKIIMVADKQDISGKRH